MYPSSGQTRLALSMADLSPFRARSRTRLHTVEILSDRFFPAALTIVGGDMLCVVNHDHLPHTFTADDGSYDSARLMTGEISQLVLMGTGTHHFHCTLGHQRICVLVEADRDVSRPGLGPSQRGLGHAPPR